MKSSTPWWVRWTVGIALPLVTRWALRQEERILAEGRPLSGEELVRARALGVTAVQRMRILPVSRVPAPGNRILRILARLTRFSTDSVAGMALGHGIYLEREYAGSRLILLHEMAHVAQYERLGGIRPFLRQYLTECLSQGYDNAPLEQEATRLAWENYRPHESGSEAETAGMV